jgi:hypothetical protein
MGHACQLFRASGGKLARVDDTDDRRGRDGASLLEIGIGPCEIAISIAAAAAAHKFQIISLHRKASIGRLSLS